MFESVKRIVFKDPYIIKIMNAKENETLGLGLNLLEGLNGLLLHKASTRKSYFSRVWIHQKIEKIIELMDVVLE